MARGRRCHAHRVNHASRFPKSERMAPYVSFPPLLSSPKISNGQFIACTSPNNAASIIAATGIQADIASNCTSLGNSTLPLSTPNNTDGGNNCTQGGYGASSSPGQVSPTPAAIPQPSLTLPPTTTTLPPEQAISLISSLSASVQTVPSTSPSVNLGGNAVGVPPVILLTSIPVSSPAPTPASTPSGGYSD
jgi:hypothetical protein